MEAALIGVSLAVKSYEAFYIPCGHRYMGAPDQLKWPHIRERLQPILENEKIEIPILTIDEEVERSQIESIKKASQTMPHLAESYKEFVGAFFSPPPPSKGYNPTLPVSDPNSPILEDREKISRLLADSLNYMVLDSLRSEPLTASEVALKTALPESIVKKVLWSLESDKVVVHFTEDDVWGLLTNPRIESFVPDYVLPMIRKKVSEKEITPQVARRHLELLIQNSGEPE